MCGVNEEGRKKKENECEYFRACVFLDVHSLPSLQTPATSVGVPRAPLTFDHLAYKSRRSFYPLRFDHSPERLTELTGSTVLLIRVAVQPKKI